MLNNYKYFLVLAEESNISSAANKLFISHQYLSKYIKDLEKEYDIKLFERKPKLTLTAAGHILYNNLRQIELLEKNTNSQLSDIKNLKTGIINFGITEGRYPIIIPKLTKEFKDVYPNIDLVVYNTTSLNMQKMLLDNKIDLYLSGTSNIQFSDLTFTNFINEKLFVIISDNMLRTYCQHYPECKMQFKNNGFNFKSFQNIPFIINKRGLISREILDNHLKNIGASINCIAELTNQYIQYHLSADDYAATVSLTMFLPGIIELNKIKRYDKESSLLNIFPIEGLNATIPTGIVYRKRTIFPKYIKDFCNILKKICLSF